MSGGGIPLRKLKIEEIPKIKTYLIFSPPGKGMEVCLVKVPKSLDINKVFNIDISNR